MVHFNKNVEKSMVLFSISTKNKTLKREKRNPFQKSKENWEGLKREKRKTKQNNVTREFNLKKKMSSHKKTSRNDHLREGTGGQQMTKYAMK